MPKRAYRLSPGGDSDGVSTHSLSPNLAGSRGRLHRIESAEVADDVFPPPESASSAATPGVPAR